MYKVSIITACFNASQYVPRLVSCLRKQTYKNFEWVVTDGGSSDCTVDLLSTVIDLNLIIDSRPDFGVYDALNRGIQLCTGDYYLVLGADDIIFPDSMEIIHAALLKTESDIYSFLVESENGNDINSKKKWPFFYSQRAYIGAHSVGTIIRKQLHYTFGYYSNKFPIAADQYFIKQACDAGATVEYIDKSIGIFGNSGLSSLDTLGQLTESLRVQIATGEYKFVQLFLFFLRILKNYNKI